jgi:hypothetical protein
MFRISRMTSTRNIRSTIKPLRILQRCSKMKHISRPRWLPRSIRPEHPNWYRSSSYWGLKYWAQSVFGLRTLLHHDHHFSINECLVFSDFSVRPIYAHHVSIIQFSMHGWAYIVSNSQIAPVCDVKQLSWFLPFQWATVRDWEHKGLYCHN